MKNLLKVLIILLVGKAFSQAPSVDLLRFKPKSINLVNPEKGWVYYGDDNELYRYTGSEWLPLGQDLTFGNGLNITSGNVSLGGRFLDGQTTEIFMEGVSRLDIYDGDDDTDLSFNLIKIGLTSSSANLESKLTTINGVDLLRIESSMDLEIRPSNHSSTGQVGYVLTKVSNDGSVEWNEAYNPINLPLINLSLPPPLTSFTATAQVRNGMLILDFLNLEDVNNPTTIQLLNWVSALPVGYRPSQTQYQTVVNVYDTNNVIRVKVSPSGDINIRYKFPYSGLNSDIDTTIFFVM
ncbi:hypothetical protein [Aquimarina sp. 2201CG14-23]|uniref:hypothetical protein n=1 Tax=Aquimarina mycalae TaxID=3040073 RepID=UPI0024780118|nr:hypothetical protein [Aquimarina sp. 2201CG14-23]MDH7444684.1 hypothetical protein [Aquimarina sp. 2201CG14-23]